MAKGITAMKINITPNLDQIRFFAKSAMHAWDYQDLETGRAQAIRDMEQILAYLDAFNEGEGVVVTGVMPIKAGIRIEPSTREGDSYDLCDRYIAQNIMGDIDDRDRGNAGVGIAEHGMRPHRLRRVEDANDNLGSGVDGPTEQ